MIILKKTDLYNGPVRGFLGLGGIFLRPPLKGAFLGPPGAFLGVFIDRSFPPLSGEFSPPIGGV
jgi:hypothetical protein